MLRELDSFVKYTIEDKRPVLVSALREEVRINYPHVAIRELLMNSVMHRSYEGSNAPTKLYEYSDRIEIDNPGNLYGKARIENFPNENDYRNPVLAEAMKTLGYVNKFGRGINMVQGILDENGNVPAQFVLDDITIFKVVVHNAEHKGSDVSGNVSGNVSGGVKAQTAAAKVRRNSIIELIRQNKDYSVSKLAELLDVSSRTISRDIDKLKTEKKLQRLGDENTGYWVFLEETPN